MKNTYLIVETDSDRSFPRMLTICPGFYSGDFESVPARFTNKAKAIKEKNAIKHQRHAGNGLRRCEGSRERYNETNIYVINERDYEWLSEEKIPWNKIID